MLSALHTWAEAGRQSQGYNFAEPVLIILHVILQKYAEETTEIPRPDNWGGYVVVPSVMEFWHGKKSRLHDRLQYTRQGDKWKMERLSP